MSWMQKLYETYENCKMNIGDSNDSQPLLPICHTPQNAHIEITVPQQNLWVNLGSGRLPSV